jgi:endonuclease/exonuclease/phosphatase family metal-dependent hydrolase
MHNKQRVKKIFDLINRLNPDLITFQEVWDVSYLDEFRKRLSQYHMVSKPNWLFNESGLMTFSKYPIIHSRLYHFTANEHYDYFEKKSKKGFLVTRIDFKGKQVNIVNTHLHVAGETFRDSKKHITLTQYRIIEDFFQNSTFSTILCGDLNLDYNDLDKVRSLFHIPNIKPITTYHIFNRYTNKRLNKTLTAERQLDYLLYIENGMGMDVNLQVLDWEVVSDHYPLYSEIEFN